MATIGDKYKSGQYSHCIAFDLGCRAMLTAVKLDTATGNEVSELLYMNNQYHHDVEYDVRNMKLRNSIQPAKHQNVINEINFKFDSITEFRTESRPQPHRIVPRKSTRAVARAKKRAAKKKATAALRRLKQHLPTSTKHRTSHKKDRTRRSDAVIDCRLVLMIIRTTHGSASRIWSGCKQLFAKTKMHRFDLKNTRRHNGRSKN